MAQQPPPPYDPNYPPPAQYPAAQDPNYPPPEKQPYPPQQQPYPPQQQPYPPQQQPYPAAPPPQQQQTTNTVVVTAQPQPVVVSAPVFRDYPVTMTNSKGQQITTQLDYRSGLLTWIVCAVICLFTIELGICCLAFIPFCVSSLKDVHHIDPTDGSTVGVYKRL